MSQEPKRPLLTEAFADNGAFSHYRLIDPEDGSLLWYGFPEEDDILYGGYTSPQKALAKNTEEWKARVVEEAKQAFIAGLQKNATLGNLYLTMPDIDEYINQLKERLKCGS